MALLVVLVSLLFVPASQAGASIPLAFGLTTGLDHDSLSRITQVESETGGHVSLVNWFQDFGSPLLGQRARAVLLSGRTPIISWQPVDPSSPAPNELARIVAGDDDAYLRSFAHAIQSLPGAVWIRFAPEMNGDWEPWGVGVHGQTAAELVEAWRHVHDVFAAAGVTNVLWFWCPNVPAPGTGRLTDLYPGDQVVDVVGVDGYNFGGARPGTTWRSYRAIFGGALSELHALSKRPIVLGEVGTVAGNGRAANWIRTFFASLDASPAVRGFVWFDISKQINTRVDASPSSLRGFRLGIRSLRRGIARTATSALGSG